MSTYIITHKQIKDPKLQGYKIIQVGARNKEHLYELTDDTKDNISYKNCSFCELTGLYWLWKNVNDDYIGIVHYRRFFVRSFFDNKYLSEQDIKRILKTNDIILPIKTKLHNETVKEQFLSNTGFEKDLDILLDVLKKKYPEYISTYYKVMNSKECYYRNMFITNKSQFDKYCCWLFDILFEFESLVDIDQYDDYHKRIFGFMSERLLSVYVDFNELKICEIGIVQTDYRDMRIKKIAKKVQRVFKYYLTK